MADTLVLSDENSGIEDGLLLLCSLAALPSLTIYLSNSLQAMKEETKNE